MSAFSYRTLRSNVRLNPYDAGPGQFIDFHSSTPNYYTPPLPQTFADEWQTTDYAGFMYLDSSVPSPESDHSIETPPSTPSSDVEEPSIPPPKAVANRRGRPANHVPRPRNAFMIFRSEFWAKQKISKNVEVDHRHISRIVGILWNELSEEGKKDFRIKAELEKLEHQRLYPTYRFTPTVRAQKPLKRKVQRNGAKDLNRCREVAGLLMAGKQGDELEQAVMTLDKEAEAEPQPIADHLYPNVRGWTPQNGISETVLVPGPPPVVQLVSNPFGYNPHFPPNVELLPLPPAQYAPNYSFTLPPDYMHSSWDMDAYSFDFNPLVRRRGTPPPSVSIEPYTEDLDRPMVTTFL
ncbi:hypothetical protein DFH09DRAFT_384471 [Mycena vulgaris]|nr:hypothetical protein DFH09DRAFT_384471 [Mycena vulgaris]